MTLQGFLAKYNPVLDRETGAGGGSPPTEQGPSGGTTSPSSGSSPSASPAPSGSSSPSSSGTPSSGSPSSSPSPAPSPGTGSGSSGGDPPQPFDFSSIFSDPGESPVVVTPPAAQPTTPSVVPPAGAEPPKPASQAAPPVATPDAASPVQQGPPQTPSAPGAERPHFDPADPIALARGLSENKAAAIDHLAKGMFALSKEDLEALETDVASTIPKLLGRAVVEAQTQMFATLGRIVPLMIRRETEVSTRHNTAESQFYDHWKDKGISKATHGDLVRRVAATVRSMNPDMPLQQIIEEVGPMVIAMAKIAPPSPVAVVPGQPNVRANGSPPQQPFIPAAPSGSTIVGSQPADDGGQFGYLGQRE